MTLPIDEDRLDAAALVRRLNETGERDRVEAKRGAEVGASVLESVCAFANEPGLDGGHVLLGVDEVEDELFPVFKVVGVKNTERLIDDLHAKCADVFNVRVRVGAEPAAVDGRTVVVIRVPEAPPSQKPVHFRKRGLPAGAFRRIGGRDERCTEDDLIVLYGDRRGTTFDAEMCPGARLDDIDEGAVEDYRRVLRDANPDAEALRWPDEELLEAVGALVRTAPGFVPTNAGVLLFGRAQALRRLFPVTRVDYIRVPGREWVPDPANRFTSADMRGPIFGLIRRTVAAVLDDLPVSFSLPEGEIERRDRRALPEAVVREAVVNALMHRNYRSHSAVQVIRYANRIEILNPGYSLKPGERLGEPRSESRNPVISAVLHETPFAETKGTGIRAMRRGMEAADLSPPTFESDREGDGFTARFLLHHFMSAEDLRWLGRLRAAGFDLTDHEAQALVFVREAGAIDNAAYRDLNLVGTAEANARLRNLRRIGLIDQKGRTRGAYYVASRELLATMLAEDAMVGKDGAMVGTGGAMVGNAAAEADGAAPFPVTDLPDDLAAAVARLGRRSSRDEVRETILRLCAFRPFSADQLGRLLDRSPKHLKNAYLFPMIGEGALAYTRPEMTKHPEQAYRAPDGGPPA